MNTNVAGHPSMHTLQYYKSREADVFGQIPGIDELRHAKDEDDRFRLNLLYPDATFALMIASSLFCENNEMSAITLRAYRSILEGENIKDVRRRYNKDLDTFVSTHMWD